jgi:hypothetical protein
MRSYPASSSRARIAPGVVRCCLLILLAAAAWGCAPAGWTETPFAREASDAGSTFSAAAEALQAAHARRLTRAYVRGAFVNFRELVEGVDARLPTLDGHPPEAALAAIVAKVDAALTALDRPCLSRDCDWRSQVDTLRNAAEALSDAADSSEARGWLSAAGDP